VTLTLNQPWSNLGTPHRLIILDICAKLFVNPTRGSKDIERTQNTVIQCLNLDCDLDLEPTLVKHRHIDTGGRAGGRAGGQAGRQTDNGAKNNTLYVSTFHGGRHNTTGREVSDLI